MYRKNKDFYHEILLFALVGVTLVLLMYLGYQIHLWLHT